jgi:hypothetical protein
VPFPTLGHFPRNAFFLLGLPLGFLPLLSFSRFLFPPFSLLLLLFYFLCGDFSLPGLLHFNFKHSLPGVLPHPLLAALYQFGDGKLDPGGAILRMDPVQVAAVSLDAAALHRSSRGAEVICRQTVNFLCCKTFMANTLFVPGTFQGRVTPSRPVGPQSLYLFPA